jgi:hypothetical protein
MKSDYDISIIRLQICNKDVELCSRELFKSQLKTISKILNLSVQFKHCSNTITKGLFGPELLAII